MSPKKWEACSGRANCRDPSTVWYNNIEKYLYDTPSQIVQKLILKEVYKWPVTYSSYDIFKNEHIWH